jgi:hypothetical protein
MALKDEPRILKSPFAGCVLFDPIVDDARIAPHDTNAIVRIDLKQELPISSAWRECFCAPVLISLGVAAVQSMGNALTLELHAVALYWRREPCDLMFRFALKDRIRQVREQI